MKAITFSIILSGFMLLGCKKESVNDMYPENDSVIIEDTISPVGMEPEYDSLNAVSPMDSTEIDIDSMNNTNP